MRIHVAVATLVIVIAFALGLPRTDLAILLLCIGTVFAAEYFNTALERLADRITTDQDPMIGAAKDLAAAAVLILAIIAAVVGGVIIVPALIKSLGA